MGISEQLTDILRQSQNIVFFGGAGVSTESGIPDFRSADGLYAEKYGTLSPEDIISASFFRRNPEIFFTFYKTKMLFPSAKPNAAHFALTKLEAMGKLKAVVTQNIDGLHTLAGTKCVYELHGSVHRNHCMRCNAAYPLSYVMDADGVPHCEKCGGVVKPDVTLYEECLNDDVVRDAVAAVRSADTLIVAGTSLRVQPAASLLYDFHGKNLVVINLEPTEADRDATCVIHGKVGTVLAKAVDAL